MRLLIAGLTLLMHVLTSPVTLAMSFGLMAGTWLICRQVRRQNSDGAEMLLTSEWLGA